jgi:hypothetical protein
MIKQPCEHADRTVYYRKSLHSSLRIVTINNCT